MKNTRPFPCFLLKEERLNAKEGDLEGFVFYVFSFSFIYLHFSDWIAL